MKKYSVWKNMILPFFTNTLVEDLIKLLVASYSHNAFMAGIFVIYIFYWRRHGWSLREMLLRKSVECRLCSRNEVFFYQVFISFLLLCWAIITIRKFLINYSEKKGQFVITAVSEWPTFLFQVSSVQFVFIFFFLFWFETKKCFWLFRDVRHKWI